MPWRPIEISEKEFQDFKKVFKKKARFLVDESLGLEVAYLLRVEGWNAKYVSELNLLGKSDEDVYKAAYKEDRILLTHDRDFLNDRRFPPYRNPGVVILPGGQGDERVLLRSLSWMILVIGQFRNIWKESKIIFHADDKMSVVSRDYKTGAIKRTIYWFQRHGPVLEWVDD